MDRSAEMLSSDFSASPSPSSRELIVEGCPLPAVQGEEGTGRGARGGGAFGDCGLPRMASISSSTKTLYVLVRIEQAGEKKKTNPK